ncbi:MAG TPA: hypothetical protein VGI04_12995 [Neobacillus sp.]
MKLDNTQPITFFWLYFVILPILIGVVVGSITAKVKPNSLRLTLMITAAISLVFLVIVLLTLQNQAIPLLAIMITVVSIIIMNASAVISHKFASTKILDK